MKDKVLITGGAGYIGSVLSRKLIENGFKIRVIDNLRYGGHSLLGILNSKNFQFMKGNIIDDEDLKEAIKNVDVIIHLAALVGEPICSKFPVEAKQVNLDATKKIIDLAKKNRTKLFILASTCSNYGTINKDEFATEENILNPISLYAKTKVESEKYLINAINEGFPGVIMRFSTVFGISPRMRFDLTVNHFTKDAFKDKKLLVYGGDTWRPYIHIRDLTEAVIKILLAERSIINGEILNIGANHLNYQKKEIAKLVKKNFKDVKLKFINKNSNDPRDYRVSFNKIYKTINFKPNISIENGIREIKDILEKGIINNFDSSLYYNA